MYARMNIYNTYPADLAYWLNAVKKYDNEKLTTRYKMAVKLFKKQGSGRAEYDALTSEMIARGLIVK